MLSDGMAMPNCFEGILAEGGRALLRACMRMTPHLDLHSPACIHRVSITGQGFSKDLFQGSNVVFIGPHPCRVNSHLSSETTIVCETSKSADAGDFTVAVIVDGFTVASKCCFTYDWGWTPSEWRAWRRSGDPREGEALQ